MINGRITTPPISSSVMTSTTRKRKAARIVKNEMARIRRISPRVLYFGLFKSDESFSFALPRSACRGFSGLRSGDGGGVSSCLVNCSSFLLERDSTLVTCTTGAGALAVTSSFRVSRSKDRKSTRLDSSHLVSAYVVCCLRNKRERTDDHRA